jgi:hypothetical protein
MISVLKFIGLLALGTTGLFFIVCCVFGIIYMISLIRDMIEEDF